MRVSVPSLIPFCVWCTLKSICSSKQRMMNPVVCNTITKYGDSRGTREYSLRRGHKQNKQVSGTFDPANITITLLLFQRYVRGIDLSRHFKLLGTYYLWLSMPTIPTWLWRMNQTRSGQFLPIDI